MGKREALSSFYNLRRRKSSRKERKHSPLRLGKKDKGMLPSSKGGGEEKERELSSICLGDVFPEERGFTFLRGKGCREGEIAGTIVFPFHTKKREDR